MLNNVGQEIGRSSKVHKEASFVKNSYYCVSNSYKISTPTNIKGWTAILAHVAKFQKYIKDFNTKAAPLVTMCNNAKAGIEEITWDEETTHAFQELLQQLQNAPL